MLKPPIKELEELLQLEEERELEILPNGQLRPKGQTPAEELGARRPVTFREDLGGEYGWRVSP